MRPAEIVYFADPFSGNGEPCLFPHTVANHGPDQSHVGRWDGIPRYDLDMNHILQRIVVLSQFGHHFMPADRKSRSRKGLSCSHVGAIHDPTDLALERIVGLGPKLDPLSGDELITIPRGDDLQIKATAHQNKDGVRKETHSPRCGFSPDKAHWSQDTPMREKWCDVIVIRILFWVGAS